MLGVVEKGQMERERDSNRFCAEHIKWLDPTTLRS